MLVESPLNAGSAQTRSATVAVVIVNFGTADLVIQCLDSLDAARSECGRLQVIVVDNASNDDSAERIAEEISRQDWQGWVELIHAPRNGGFAYGSNLGIRRALESPDSQVDAVWLLNSDTVVRPGALETLLEALKTHPEAGIVGSRLEDWDGTAQRSAFRFQTVTREWARGLNLGLWFRLFPAAEIAPAQEERQFATDWLAGASMLIRRETVEQTGLFDEGYFLYFEEVDFCLRAARDGWKTIYVPASRVVHLVGQSSGVTSSDACQRRVPKYWFESRARFFSRNYGSAARILADGGWLSGHLIYRARCLVQRKQVSFPPHLLRDFMRYNFWWPSRVS